MHWYMSWVGTGLGHAWNCLLALRARSLALRARTIALRAHSRATRSKARLVSKSISSIATYHKLVLITGVPVDN